MSNQPNKSPASRTRGATAQESVASQPTHQVAGEHEPAPAESEKDREARERFDAEGGAQKYGGERGAEMNNDVLQGKWKQVRGAAKVWWGRLTDDDLDQVAGQKDKLVGFLQERYGYAREQAHEEVDRRLKEFDTKRPS